MEENTLKMEILQEREKIPQLFEYFARKTSKKKKSQAVNFTTPENNDDGFTNVRSSCVRLACF